MINKEEIEKPVLIALGIYFPGYSFTRVFNELLNELSAYYNIHWSGIAYKGEVRVFENYTLHPSNVNGGDIYGAFGASSLAQELNADAVLVLNDFYLLKNYKIAWQSLKEKGIKIMAYVPMDGTITDVNIVEECFFLDELVLYHEAAKNDVRKAIEKFKEKNKQECFTSPNLSFLYHGVDTETFQLPATDQKMELKKELFQVPDPEKAVFILNGNRYNERKDLATSISSFANAFPHFQRQAYLVLHTPNLPAEKRSELENLISNSGTQQNILLNPLGEDYVSDEELKKLYQACDIGINTSYGEGWGMISFEHAACGGAQIVPAHSAPGELWKKAGVIIPNKNPIQLNTNPFLMYSIDGSILSEEMIALVNDQRYLEMVSNACYAHANREEFNWINIAKKWYKQISSTGEIKA